MRRIESTKKEIITRLHEPGWRAGQRTRKCGYQVSNKLSGMKRAIQSTGSPGCWGVRYLVMLSLPQ